MIPNTAVRSSRSLKPITIATMFAYAAMSAMSAQAADGVVIIGDSLSDGGYYAAIGGQRFTTNPGKTAAEYIAEDLGFTTTPSNQGGSNYAQGGAKVNSDSLSTPPGFAQRPISAQVTEFLSANAGQASNKIILIQGGANDAFQNLAMYSGGYITQAQLAGLTQQSVVDFVTQIAKLSYLSGSEQIIVQNMPNLGVAPAFQSAGAAAAAGASQLAQGFNAGVSQGLAQTGLSVVLLDNYSLISEVVANPTAYGFTNATGVACTVSSSLFCSANTLVSPDAASTYVFADGVHPTTAAQKLSAQYALSVLKAPAQVGVVGAAAMTAGQRYAQRLMSYAPNVSDQAWHAFADAGYSKTDFGKAADSKNKYLLVGADRRISAGNVHAGLTLGYDRASGDLGAAAGEFNLKETSVGAYVGKKADQGAIMGYVRYGRLSADIDRNIALGAANRTESGSSKGAHYTIGVQGNLVLGTFANGKVKHGPVGGFAYEKMRLDGYDEAGNTSTSMSFGAQKREGMVASLGYQLRGEFGKVKPYASLSYEVDGTDADNIKARLKSAPTSFSTEAPKSDNGVRLKLGAQIDLAKNVNLVVGAERTFGKDSGQQTVFNLGVDARF